MSAPRRPRVLLADDHLMVAEALKSLLTPEFELLAAGITASYSDARDGEQTEVRLAAKGVETSISVEKVSKGKFQKMMI